MTKPTDAEIGALVDQFRWDTAEGRLQLIRAVLAKWGTPPVVAADNQPAPVSSDTLYLLRRLLSNQHTLTSAEFREELTKIVGEATQAEVL